MEKKKIIARLERAIWSRDGQEKGGEVYFLCPSHDDHNPSARWNPEKEVWYCDACGDGGGFQDLAEKLKLSLDHLCDPPENPCTLARDIKDQKENAGISGANPLTGECTIVNYAKSKRLPVSFLSELGLADFKYQGKPAIKIPYRNTNGGEIAVRFRTSLQGNDRFKWKTGSKPQLYGLWKLQEAKQAGYVVLVEGESDCHTLWHHKLPALGLPGASNWRDDWCDYFNGIPTIYVLLEPDQGGETVLKWLAKSKIRERVKLVRLESCKDPSEFYLLNLDCFSEAFKKVLERAVSWTDQQNKENEVIKCEQWEICKDLATQPNILESFEADLLSLGFVGETKTAQLIYLALTSRVFERPVSIAIKGPSSGGKSYLAERVMNFFPENACYELTTMSDRSLIYLEEPLSHRFLVIFEASGSSSDMASLLIRSLLSESKLKYDTVEKTDQGFKARHINKEGPTGLLTTTTAVKLHSENETRILSLSVLDTSEQTKEIMKSLADENHYKSKVDFEKWHAFQEWIALGETKVTIPYAKRLAELVPPVSVRLRRDFLHILTLIQSHALLHQATRERNLEGKIVATLADYEAVKELAANIISDGVGATVSDTIRETVEAVRLLSDPNEPEFQGVTINELAGHLKLDPSAVKRRVKVALAHEFLQNMSPPRKKIRLKLGNPLPDALQILPDSKQLSEEVQECSKSQEVSIPLFPESENPGDSGSEEIPF